MKVELAILVVVATLAAASDVQDRVLADNLAEFLSSTDKKATDLKKLLLERLLVKGSGAKKVINKEPKLACPIPTTWFETFLDEKQYKKCEGNDNCGDKELCCPWFRKKHCLLGIPTTPRKGECPAIGPVNDACIADFVGCQYDEECHNEDEKCCENTLCHYKECLSIRQNIACPAPKTSFPTKRSEPRCVKDVACGDDEKCCDWFGEKHCMKGISTIQRPGWCPNVLPKAFESCIADYPGCMHDEECPGPQEKCCFNSACNYHQCIDINVEFACPTINFNSESQRSSSKKSCETNADCGEFTSLCCAVDGKEGKECRNGIHTVPKDGQCPNPSATANPKGGACDKSSKGDCEYDSECPGNGKCCMTQCDYKQCVNLTKKETTDGEEDNTKRDVLENLIDLLKRESH